MGVHVVVVYTPKPGAQDLLEREVAAHVPTLRRLGLATAAASLALRSSDGSIVEYFEWTHQLNAHWLFWTSSANTTRPIRVQSDRAELSSNRA